ncbi:MAG: ferredoxin [Pseudonocardia sp. SCN 72-86]|nr:MAG: ferredoxin [Pseudonocardia sp. SCN 72-86]
MTVRIDVDRGRCEGYGFCEQAAPDFFRLDDDGELVIERSEAPDSTLGTVEAAARLCPVAALRISG